MPFEPPDRRLHPSGPADRPPTTDRFVVIALPGQVGPPARTSGGVRGELVTSFTSAEAMSTELAGRTDRPAPHEGGRAPIRRTVPVEAREMHAEYYSWFDGRRTPSPVPWDVDDATSAPVPNAKFLAEVLRALEDMLVTADPASADRLRSVRVVVTPNPWNVPWTGPDVVAVLVLDNWARVPRWADEVGLALATSRDRSWHDALSMLPRWLGTLELVDEARVRIERAAWRRHSGKTPSGRGVVALPLGFAHQREVPLVPWSQRTIDVYFAGSTSHGLDKGGPLRRAARRNVGNIKTLHRARMGTAVERLRSTHPDLRVRIDLVDGDRAAEHSDSYSRNMARARFSLDPRGTSRETYRYYEAVRSGCVPVVTSLPTGGLYATAPAVRLRHWSQLSSAMRYYTDHPGEAEALHAACLDWYATVGGPEATARRLLPHFQKVLAGLPRR